MLQSVCPPDILMFFSRSFRTEWKRIKLLCPSITHLLPSFSLHFLHSYTSSVTTVLMAKNAMGISVKEFISKNSLPLLLSLSHVRISDIFFCFLESSFDSLTFDDEGIFVNMSLSHALFFISPFSTSGFLLMILFVVVVILRLLLSDFPASHSFTQKMIKGANEGMQESKEKTRKIDMRKKNE